MTAPVALVMGGSRGIGRAVVETLAARGMDVVIHAHAHVEEARELAARVAAQGRRAHVISFDLSTPSLPEGWLEGAEAALGPVRHLVYAAGIPSADFVVHHDVEDWQRVLAVNLNGAMLVAREVLAAMAKRRAGSAVFVSSIADGALSKGNSAYAASKAALNALAKSAALELGPRGVRVNVVAPGLVETDMLAKLPAELRQATVARTPLGRVGQPAEIAAAVQWLLSDEASFVTGAVLPVSGGLDL